MTLAEKAKSFGHGTNVDAIAARHVSISELNPSARANTNHIPVHIMFRETETNEWQLIGTGTTFAKLPGWLLTAHHVMDNKGNSSLGEYGYRLIGTNEFSGHERIVPIVSFRDSPNQDDAIICHYNINSTNYPIIEVPKWEAAFNLDKVFHSNHEVNLTLESYPAHIHLFTYPDRVFDGAFMLHVRPDLSYIFFDYDPVPGESGTGGMVDEETKSNTVIVLTMKSQIPGQKLTPDFQRLINWSPGRFYGVAIMMTVDPY